MHFLDLFLALLLEYEEIGSSVSFDVLEWESLPSGSFQQIVWVMLFFAILWLWLLVNDVVFDTWTAQL